MNGKDNVYIDNILQKEVKETTRAIVKDAHFSEIYDKVNKDFNSLSNDERLIYYAVSDGFDVLVAHLGDYELLNMMMPDIVGEHGMDSQDTDDAFEKTTKSFKLATEPVQGIEDIIDYNPNSDSVSGILEQRAGNSTTLKWNEKKVAEEKEILQKKLESGKINKEEYDDEIKYIDDAVKARAESLFSFGSASSLTRMHASQLMNKTTVTYSDVFNAFSEINSFVNMNNKDNPNPGTLRGGHVQVADDAIIGVGVGNVASDMYKTTQMIADCINDIKAEKDPALQKTQAVQLAAFTYQLTLSEHMFKDGNGRSSRMLADTILQTFGLPPHIPMPQETKIAASLGQELDFNKGAEVYFEGVKQSSIALKALKKEGPEKKQSSGEKAKGREHKKTEVTEDVAKQLTTYKGMCIKAKGTFKDSPQYKKFLDSVDIAESLANTIADAAKNGTSINKDKLSPKAKAMVEAIRPGKELNLADAKRMFNQSVSTVEQCAKDYVNYKLADHTFDKTAEPNKKALNADDIKKLKLMTNVLGKNLGTNKEIKFPEENKNKVKEQEVALKI